MARGEKASPIAGEIYTPSLGGTVLSAEGVKDYIKGENQETVNHEVDLSLENLNTLLLALQREINSKQYEAEALQTDALPTENSDKFVRSGGIFTAISQVRDIINSGYLYVGIATPSTNPGIPSSNCFYVAVVAGTYTNFGSLVLEDGNFNFIKWDGTSWSVDTLTNVGSGLGVYDVSVKYPTSGPNGDGKFTLDYILNPNNVNELIPANKRKPGMTIQFVSTFDNKYVQYRLTARDFSTNESDWQDVSSASVSDVIALRTSITDGYYIDYNTKALISNSVFSYCDYIPVYKGARLLFYNTITSDYSSVSGAYYDINKTALSAFALATMGVGVKEVTIPENARYVRLSIVKDDKDKFFAGIDYSPAFASVDHPQDILDAIAANTQKADDATGYIGIYGKLSSKWMTAEKGINASTGAIESKGFTYTNERFIRCVPGGKIYSKLRTFAGNLELAFYTEAKASTFQSGIEGDNTLHERVTTVPSGCYYFRYSSIEMGSAGYLYYNVEAKLYEINKTLEQLPTIQNEIENIKTSIDKAEDIPFTLTQGKDIFVNTGGESGFGTTSWVTDYIDIHNYKIVEFLDRYTAVYTAPVLGFAFYDSQKNYIGGSPYAYAKISGVGKSIKATKFIVPNGAYYFRTSIPNLYKDSFYIKGYKEDAKGFNFVYGGRNGFAVANSLNVGDTVALSAASGTLTFRVPTFNAKGVYVPTYVGGTSFVEYVVIDQDNKILKKGGNTAHNEQITYIDLTDIDSAVSIWFTTYFADEYVSHIIYNNGEFIMDRGSKKYINTISNSVKVGNTADNDDIYNVNIVNTSEGRTVTIDFQGECMSNLSLFAKINSMADIDKIKTVTIRWLIGTTEIMVSAVDGRTLFQTNDWVRIQRCKVSNHQTFTANKVSLNFTFAGGQSADSNIDIQICNTMIVDSFYKPIFGINFDHTWVATETCGVYDELLDNNIPFTITGNWAVTTAIGNKMAAAYRKGLCDIGKYGGNTDPDQLVIDVYQSYPTLLSRIADAVQYRNSQGIECVSFGPGSHKMSPILLRALIANRFDCVRCGNSGIGDINIIPRNRKGIIEGGQGTCLNMGTMGILFSHGVSTNPSEETDPTMYMSYTTFESYFSRALGFYQQGAALILNMKQIAALRSNYDIFGLNLT